MSRLTDIIPNLNRKTKQLPCAVKWLGQDHLHPLLEQLRQTCHGWRLWNEPGPPLWEATTLAKSYLFETCLRYIVIASFYIFYHYLICRSSNFLSNGSSLILLCRKTDFKGGGAWSNESDSCYFITGLWFCLFLFIDGLGILKGLKMVSFVHILCLRTQLEARSITTDSLSFLSFFLKELITIPWCTKCGGWSWIECWNVSAYVGFRIVRDRTEEVC